MPSLCLTFTIFIFALSSYCSGHFAQNGHRHAGHVHSKRQVATNSSTVDPSITPLKAENISFFADAPVNFLMRQPWSAENITEAKFHAKFAPALDLVTTTAADSNDYTCGANKACRLHLACCNGVSGQCGYGPEYCGSDVCISDCDAKAECGQYAAVGKEECPLKVCCSKFGFCGTTSEFCADGCQTNCIDPKPSGRRAKNPQARVIAYYEAWSPSKACGNMEPEEIPVEGLTHLNFAFAYITPNTYNIAAMDSRTSESMFTKVTSTKERNADLKVWVALGGWTFNDNGTDTQPVFTSLCKTKPARSRFITNLVAFMSQYGFDGVDIDWEYPGAEDRGGNPDDAKNFVLLVQEMRIAFDGEGKSWGISFTVPTSYWYLRWFDVAGMAKYVDWINVMSYDLHGVWDKLNPIGSVVNPHTNLTEIDDALKLLWRVGVAPEKIVLGIAFYGRAFQLSDGSCTKAGCAFAGPASKGICTGEEGILSYMEIQNVLSRTGAKPIYDKAAGVQYVVFNGNQWVSYDDAVTIQQKIDFAKDRGLSGLMTWAVDLDDDKSSLLKVMSGKTFTGAQWGKGGALKAVSGEQSDLGSKCKVTACHAKGEMSCPNGYLFQTYMYGPGYTVAANPSCPNDQQRSLCCPADHNPDRSKCKWSICAWPCDSGYTYITQDWVGDKPTDACSPRVGNNYRNYCCKVDNFKQFQDSCKYSACNVKSKCGEKGMTDYTQELASAYTWTEGLPSLCPRQFCQNSAKCDSERKSAKFCCKPSKKVKSCKWRGSPNGVDFGLSTGRDTCYNNECLQGEIVFDRATDGDDPKNPCFETSPKVLCCTPGDGADDNFDIDPAHLVPADLRQGTDIGVGSHISANVPATASFFTFMSVIGAKSDVVSLDKRDGSHLEFFDCSPTPARQTVKVICTKTGEGSNCEDVHEGGLWGTVVRLPEGCGRSRWARAISMTEATEQRLPRHLEKRNLPSDAKIHDFTFDYDFKNLKRAAGKIAFRIDQSNLASYWTNIVDSSAKRDDNPLERREREDLKAFFANQTSDSELHKKTPHELYGHYHKRWYGDDAGKFASKATSGDSGGFFNSFDFTIASLNYAFREEITCTSGKNKYKAVGEINAVGKVTGKVKFGATMYGELWPNFGFRQSYVYMRGVIKGDFALQVTSDNIWDMTSDNMEFLKQFQIPKTSYEIDGIGQIYLYAGARGKLYAKGEWSGSINVPWKWQTEPISLTVPSNAEVPDSAGFEKEGMDIGASVTPQYALGTDKLQMSVSIKPYVGLGFGIGAGDPGKKGSNFLHVAGLEMETEIRSVIEVHHDVDHKEVCVDVYGQVGVNGVAISPLAGWLLGKDRTEYALWHSGLSAIKSQCFITGEIGKRGETSERALPRGIPTTPENQIIPNAHLKRGLSTLAKRTQGISCRNDKTKVDPDTDCSKCLIDNGFAADYDTGDVVIDTDICDIAKRDIGSERPRQLAIFLRNETTIDNTALRTHLEKRATTPSKIAKCQLQWTSAKYDSCSAFQKKTGKSYYDDVDQASCVDFRVKPYSTSQRPKKGQYATEHVYELNFIKDFLEFLRNQEYHDAVKEDSNKYLGLGCSQLSDTFWAKSNGVLVIDKIMAQLGSRDNDNLLAILFKDVNGMKFRALARDDRASIVGADTWKKSTWREKYSHLKRVGGVASYMKTPEIEKMFVTASNGVYDVMGASDSFKYNLAPRYALWMDHLIKAYNEGMKSFVQSKAKELFDAHTAKAATGYTQQEADNLERMAKNGNPNFDMWWSPSGLKK